MTNRNRITIVIVCLLFMAPIVLAMWLRFGAAGWRPATGNHGELIEPPIRLEEADAVTRRQGYWLVIQIVPEMCAQSCTDLSDALRSVRVALGKDSHRVKRLQAGPGSDLKDALITQLGQVNAGAVYLVDPRSFLMMRYRPGFDPNGLLEDLERLLRYSKVGVQ